MANAEEENSFDSAAVAAQGGECDTPVESFREGADVAERVRVLRLHVGKAPQSKVDHLKAAAKERQSHWVARMREVIGEKLRINQRQADPSLSRVPLFEVVVSDNVDLLGSCLTSRKLNLVDGKLTPPRTPARRVLCCVF